MNVATRLAEEIVSVLSFAALRVDCEERDDLCYRVRSRSLKLRSIVLNRAALLRLMTAPDAAVKIEYLKRDLLRSAVEQAEYRYPHMSFRGTLLAPTSPHE